MELILASQSPRRRELLGMITEDFTVRVSQADETLTPGVTPEEGVKSLALRKAQAVADALPHGPGQAPGGWCVVGADTLVVITGEILGKPRDHDDCVAMLRRLSGREHTVYTGVAVLTSGGASRVFCEATQVQFYPLTEEEIQDYAATGEPYDKAGAYGIQGRGGVLVRGIHGDFYNVMGLPVGRLYRSLRELGAL